MEPVLTVNCPFLFVFLPRCLAAAACAARVPLIHQVSHFMPLSLRSLFSSGCSNPESAGHECTGKHRTLPPPPPLIELFPLLCYSSSCRVDAISSHSSRCLSLVIMKGCLLVRLGLDRARFALPVCVCFGTVVLMNGLSELDPDGGRPCLTGLCEDKDPRGATGGVAWWQSTAGLVYADGKV